MEAGAVNNDCRFCDHSIISLMGEPDAIALIEFAMPYLNALEARGKYLA